MRIKIRLEQLEKHRAVTNTECICFPENNPAVVSTEAEYRAVKAVPCPLHGERQVFLVYRAAWLRREPKNGDD
jgi:hypothetical protein